MLNLLKRRAVHLGVSGPQSRSRPTLSRASIASPILQKSNFHSPFNNNSFEKDEENKDQRFKCSNQKFSTTASNLLIGSSLAFFYLCLKDSDTPDDNDLLQSSFTSPTSQSADELISSAAAEFSRLFLSTFTLSNPIGTASLLLLCKRLLKEEEDIDNSGDALHSEEKHASNRRPSSTARDILLFLCEGPLSPTSKPSSSLPFLSTISSLLFKRWIDSQRIIAFSMLASLLEREDMTEDAISAHSICLTLISDILSSPPSGSSASVAAAKITPISSKSLFLPFDSSIPSERPSLSEPSLQSLLNAVSSIVASSSSSNLKTPPAFFPSMDMDPKRVQKLRLTASNSILRLSHLYNEMGQPLFAVSLASSLLPSSPSPLLPVTSLFPATLPCNQDIQSDAYALLSTISSEKLNELDIARDCAKKSLQLQRNWYESEHRILDAASKATALAEVAHDRFLGLKNRLFDTFPQIFEHRKDEQKKEAEEQQQQQNPGSALEGEAIPLMSFLRVNPLRAKLLLRMEWARSVLKFDDITESKDMVDDPSLPIATYLSTHASSQKTRSDCSLKLAEISLKTGRFDSFEQHMKQQDHQQQPSADALLLQAQAALLKGDISQAESLALTAARQSIVSYGLGSDKVSFSLRLIAQCRFPYSSSSSCSASPVSILKTASRLMSVPGEEIASRSFKETDHLIATTSLLLLHSHDPESSSNLINDRISSHGPNLLFQSLLIQSQLSSPHKQQHLLDTASIRSYLLQCEHLFGFNVFTCPFPFQKPESELDLQDVPDIPIPVSKENTSFFFLSPLCSDATSHAKLLKRIQTCSSFENGEMFSILTTAAALYSKIGALDRASVLLESASHLVPSVQLPMLAASTAHAALYDKDGQRPSITKTLFGLTNHDAVTKMFALANEGITQSIIEQSTMGNSVAAAAAAVSTAPTPSTAEQKLKDALAQCLQLSQKGSISCERVAKALSSHLRYEGKWNDASLVELQYYAKHQRS